VDDVEERGQAIYLPAITGQPAGEVEAEAIDVHLHEPVAQAIHNELKNVWVGNIETVAAASEVNIMPAILA
jgi:hypothetical protein